MDLQNTAMLSAGDKVKIGPTGLTTFPLAGWLIDRKPPQNDHSLSFSGPGVTKSVKAGLKAKKRKVVVELVDIWNHVRCQLSSSHMLVISEHAALFSRPPYGGHPCPRSSKS